MEVKKMNQNRYKNYDKKRYKFIEEYNFIPIIYDKKYEIYIAGKFCRTKLDELKKIIKNRENYIRSEQ